jgi:hypothetical protein
MSAAAVRRRKLPALRQGFGQVGHVPVARVRARKCVELVVERRDDRLVVRLRTKEEVGTKRPRMSSGFSMPARAKSSISVGVRSRPQRCPELQLSPAEARALPGWCTGRRARYARRDQRTRALSSKLRARWSSYKWPLPGAGQRAAERSVYQPCCSARAKSKSEPRPTGWARVASTSTRR